MATKGQQSSCFSAVIPYSCPAQTLCSLAALNWEKVSQVTPSTSLYGEHLCNYWQGDIQEPVHALWPGEQLLLHWGHCQGHGAGALTNTISCPVSQQLFCPEAWQPLQGICPLGREQHDVCICLGFFWGPGLAFHGKDSKWEGCRGSFCEQQLPSCWPEPVPASPKTEPLLAKAVSISHLLVAVGKRLWGGQWNGQLEMWTKGFSSLHTASMPQWAGGAQEALRGHSRATVPKWPEGFPTAYDAMLSNQTMGMEIDRDSPGSETGWVSVGCFSWAWRFFSSLFLVCFLGYFLIGWVLVGWGFFLFCFWFGLGFFCFVLFWFGLFHFLL